MPRAEGASPSTGCQGGSPTAWKKALEETGHGKVQSRPQRVMHTSVETGTHEKDQRDDTEV